MAVSLPEKQTFADRLRLLRGGESQSAFARRIGVTRKTVVNYETRGTMPRGAVLIEICKQCGVSQDWLLKGFGTGPSKSSAAVSGEAFLDVQAAVLQKRCDDLEESVGQLRNALESMQKRIAALERLHLL